MQMSIVMINIISLPLLRQANRSYETLNCGSVWNPLEDSIII